MINKNSILLIVSLLLTVSLQAQNIGDLFKSMPADLLPGISEGDKTLLLVDTAKTSIPYMFGKINKVEHGTDFIKIETSDRGSTQLKLLPFSEDSTVLCVVTTVCGGVNADVCDSDISFYSSEWIKLNSDDFLQDISAEIFFDSSKKESENYKYALSLPDISPISAEFNKDNSDLLLIFNYKEHLSVNQIREIAPFLKNDTITLKWENSSFR